MLLIDTSNIDALKCYIFINIKQLSFILSSLSKCGIKVY